MCVLLCVCAEASNQTQNQNLNKCESICTNPKDLSLTEIPFLAQANIN